MIGAPARFIRSDPLSEITAGLVPVGERYIGHWGDFDMYMSDLAETGLACKLTLQMGDSGEETFHVTAVVTRYDKVQPWSYAGHTTYVNNFSTMMPSQTRMDCALTDLNEHLDDPQVGIFGNNQSCEDGDALARLGT